MRFHRTRPAERVLPVEITPMIDVVFLLIIFFMIAARVAQETRADLDLPPERGEQQEAGAEAGVIVNVEAGGRIIVGSDTLDLPGLEAMLKEEISRLPGRDPRRLRVMLRADRRADSAHLNRILERLRALGAGTVRVATEVPR